MTKILTLVKYYFFSLKRNKGRVVDLFVWPILELLVFGFMGTYLNGQTLNSGSRILVILIGSLIFWHFFARISSEIYQQLFDDVLSKNLQNILITPIKNSEIVVALVLSSVIKMAINMVIIILTALFFYKFNFLVGNTYIILMILILMIWGMSIGIGIASLLFVFGNKILSIGWVITGLVQPFSCVFYSREVLPGLFRKISYLIPASYVFELYKKHLSGVSINLMDFWWPFFLAVIYLLIAVSLFMWFIKLARKNGTLIKI